MSSSLIEHLQQAELYDHPVRQFQLIETHISWVLLTGDYVYKIKKPVDFGFLDFTTLDKRHYFCQQELTLNRRLAPQIYLDVVAITGSPGAPEINGRGPAIEYAVKMRQFPQQARLDQMLSRGELTPDLIDRLARRIAAFHADIEAAERDTPWGTVEAIGAPVRQNFQQIGPLLEDEEDRTRLGRLEQWSLQRFEALKPLFERRHRDGFIRNGHGDMHLGNIAVVDDEIIIFDCIEFNDAFRWIDVISDIAFTTMDLDDRGQTSLAARLIDTYLQYSGDYEGLRLYDFYRVYRALVRAKVACLRLGQAGLSDAERRAAISSYRNYLQLAERYAQASRPVLCITHGVSGSGKTTLSQPLLERYGMIRIRSDVERKRLYGYGPEARTDGSIYSADANEKTYGRLAHLAREVIESGLSVIIDATFLKRRERARFAELGQQLKVPFIILHFHAPEALLKKWIRTRQALARDASEATVEIMEQQLRWADPLEADEADAIIAIDTQFDDAADKLVKQIESMLDDGVK